MNPYTVIVVYFDQNEACTYVEWVDADDTEQAARKVVKKMLDEIEVLDEESIDDILVYAGKLENLELPMPDELLIGPEWERMAAAAPSEAD